MPHARGPATLRAIGHDDRALHRDGAARRQPAVPRAADDRQAPAPAARRRACGLEHLSRVLPGRAARRLRLRARCRRLAVAPPPAGAPRGARPRSAGGPAGRGGRPRRRPSGANPTAWLLQDARRVDRPAVPRALGERAGPAELVLRHDPPAGGVPLVPVRGEQRREPGRRSLAYPTLVEPLLPLRARVSCGRAPTRSTRRSSSAARVRTWRALPATAEVTGRASAAAMRAGACGPRRSRGGSRSPPCPPA